MHLPEALLLFSDYLKFEKRYSSHTCRAYIDDLNQLKDFLLLNFQCENLSEVNSGFLRTWLAAQKDAGMTGRTINRKMSSAKSFFKYLQRQQITDHNPAGVLQAQKTSKRLPQYVEKGDLDQLWNQDFFSDDWNGKTARLMMQLFYQCGIRLSELIGLKEVDVSPYTNTIKILGKGNKERILPCNAALIGHLVEYAQEKRRFLERFDGEVLLVKADGEKLYPKWVYNHVRLYLNLVTTITKRSPHVLRHSFATHLMNEGAELQAVKELLGHSSLAATQIYTHNTIEKLKVAFQNAHPKA